MGDEFDVAIVGGGPVGLWLACELALAVGVERRTERVTQSRALSIHGRTLEVCALRAASDMELVLQGGSRTTLYRLLEDGRWVQLLRMLNEETSSEARDVTKVTLAPDFNEGLFADVASVVVRPDGCVAHLRAVGYACGAERAMT